MRIFGNSSKEKGQRRGRKMRVGGGGAGEGGVNTKVNMHQGMDPVIQKKKNRIKILPICSMEKLINYNKRLIK
jgi:hypothetical protein